MSTDVAAPETMNFFRPMGVPGEARAVDLSREAEPADEHLLNAVQLLRCAGFLPEEQQRYVLDEAGTRIAHALKAIAEHRLTARSHASPEAIG